MPHASRCTACAQGLREEVSHLRSRLLEAQTATLGELLQMAVDDLRRPTSVPDAEVVQLQQVRGTATPSKCQLLSNCDMQPAARPLQSTEQMCTGLLLVPTLQGRGAVATYVRVLEHALCECEARQASMKHALSEAQYLEQQARALLTAARGEQVACQVRHGVPAVACLASRHPQIPAAN